MAISWDKTLGSMDDSLESLMARRKLENNGLLQLAQVQDQMKTSQMNRDTLTEQRGAFADYRKAQADNIAETATAKKTEAAEEAKYKQQVEAMLADPQAETKYGKQTMDAIKLQYYAKVKPTVNLTEKDPADKHPILPVMRISREGQMEKIGEAPQGTHFATEPSPTTASIQFTPEMVAGAQKLVETGAMPMTINRGNAGLMGPVLENVGKSGTVDSIGVNRASNLADTKSLRDLQATVDSMEGFKRATVANGQQLKSLLGKIPDSGVPWLNVPLRQLNKNLVGAEYATAIEAARQIHAREVARITNNPRLVGNMTDSARQEVSAMIDVDKATIPQIMRAMDVMQRDMDNVTHEMKGQIDIVKGRLRPSGTPGVTTASPDGGDSGPVAVKAGTMVVDPSGKPHRAKKDTTLPTGWKLQ